MKIYFSILMLCLTISANSQNTILWEIRNENSPNVSYLMGTLHPTGAHFIDSLYPTIKEKLLQSELAIFETIGENKTRKEIYQRKDNFQYKKVLKKKYAQRLEKIMARKAYPLSKLSPPEVFLLLEKTVVEERCDNYIATDSLLQLDDYLELVAKQRNIEIQGLETHSEQLKLINKNKQNIDWSSVKKDKQYLQLFRNLIDVNSGLGNTQNRCASSKRYKALEINYDFQKACPDNILVKERNGNWMAKLPDYLLAKNCFIAIGLTHLYYDCGLVEQLETNGFSVTPVPLK